MTITTTMRALLSGARHNVAQLSVSALIVPSLLAAALYFVWGDPDSQTVFVSATALYAIGATLLGRIARLQLGREQKRRTAVESDLRQLRLRSGVVFDVLTSLRPKRR